MKIKTPVLFTICLLTVTTVIAQDDAAVLYSAGTVYTMSGEPISPGQVLVENGKIKAVDSVIPAATRGDATLVELGEGSVLMPGLIDAYTQSGMGADSSDEVTKEITPNFRAARSIDWKSTDMKQRLHAGTTTMCVCPGTQNVVSGIASIVKTGGEQVVNDDYALVASICSDPTARNSSRQRPDSIYVRQPTNRMGVVWILRNSLSKVKQGKMESAPLAEALNGKRPFFIVSRVAHDLSTAATLAEEFDFQPILVGGHESYKITDLISARNYSVILGGTTTGSMFGPEQTELCWNQAGILDEAGITFCISGNNQLEQARFAHRFGLDANKALAAITTSPAQILGINERVGTIEIGKDADLIALQGDPLEFTTAIEWVMVDGKITEPKNTTRQAKGN
ncbi:MAG: amidohydrolase family protein [Pirellulaceae bacterium]|nr:amidohydrolase family protein [Pirellulaceae bacterium]